VTILDERGLFWWHHEPIPERQFAPDSYVPGLLRIDDDGRITLELDGRLPSDKGLMSVLPSFQDAAELNDKLIQGILKGSNKHVLLSDLTKDGGHFSTRGISYEEYIAMNCLVGDHSLPTMAEEILYEALDVDLAGFEEWFRLGSIVVNRTKSTLSANYEQDKGIACDVDNGKIAVEFLLYGPYPGMRRSNKLELKEAISLSLILKKPVTLDQMRTELGVLEDLLVILTNSEYRLTWPSIVIEREKEKYKFKWYFRRLRSEAAEPPKSHDSPTNFVQLRENFGSIVSAWQSKREQFGPGFYLYLAVRRGMILYPEHRFVNLIWGIEALHRKKYPPASPTCAELKMKVKVSRIVAQVEPAKDKKWLEGRLKNAHEPSLEQRIFDVVTSVPIRLDVDKIREFSKRCAELRNEISHFGAQRHGGDYANFTQELMKKSEALSVVYHMLILHEIGIDASTLCWWIYDGHHSYREKRTLVEGGLLDASILKPVSPSAPVGP
jgi:hypothetical protein